jgi:hypothetical protein
MSYLEFFCEHWFFSLCLGMFVYGIVDCKTARIYNIFVLKYNQARNENVTQLNIHGKKVIDGEIVNDNKS